MKLHHKTQYAECTKLSTRKKVFMKANYLSRLLKVENDLEGEFTVDQDSVFNAFKTILIRVGIALEGTTTFVSKKITIYSTVFKLFGLCQSVCYSS